MYLGCSVSQKGETDETSETVNFIIVLIINVLYFLVKQNETVFCEFLIFTRLFVTYFPN